MITPLYIGVLALQGAFAEHESSLERLSSKFCVKGIQVRTVNDLNRCDALIIPGGESSTIALVARSSGLIEPLKEFIRTKPVWGTCAGAILLSQFVRGAKTGGQELFGGVSITTERNSWGSQTESFEAPLTIEGLRDPTTAFQGVFIRAPIVLELTPGPNDPPIQVIARLPAAFLPSHLRSETESEDPKTIVALRQGRHLMTTFHPELTRDDRFHEYFVTQCVRRQ